MVTVQERVTQAVREGRSVDSFGNQIRIDGEDIVVRRSALRGLGISNVGEIVEVARRSVEAEKAQQTGQISVAQSQQAELARISSEQETRRLQAKKDEVGRFGGGIAQAPARSALGQPAGTLTRTSAAGGMVFETREARKAEERISGGFGQGGFATLGQAFKAEETAQKTFRTEIGITTKQAPPTGQEIFLEATREEIVRGPESITSAQAPMKKGFSFGIEGVKKGTPGLLGLKASQKFSQRKGINLGFTGVTFTKEDQEALSQLSSKERKDIGRKILSQQTKILFGGTITTEEGKEVKGVAAVSLGKAQVGQKLFEEEVSKGLLLTAEEKQKLTKEVAAGVIFGFPTESVQEQERIALFGRKQSFQATQVLERKGVPTTERILQQLRKKGGEAISEIGLKPTTTQAKIGGVIILGETLGFAGKTILPKVLGTKIGKEIIKKIPLSVQVTTAKVLTTTARFTPEILTGGVSAVGIVKGIKERKPLETIPEIVIRESAIPVTTLGLFRGGQAVISGIQAKSLGKPFTTFGQDVQKVTIKLPSGKERTVLNTIDISTTIQEPTAIGRFFAVTGKKTVTTTTPEVISRIGGRTTGPLGQIGTQTTREGFTVGRFKVRQEQTRLLRDIEFGPSIKKEFDIETLTKFTLEPERGTVARVIAGVREKGVKEITLVKAEGLVSRRGGKREIVPELIRQDIIQEPGFIATTGFRAPVRIGKPILPVTQLERFSIEKIGTIKLKAGTKLPERLIPSGITTVFRKAEQFPIQKVFEEPRILSLSARRAEKGVIGSIKIETFRTVGEVRPAIGVSVGIKKELESIRTGRVSLTRTERFRERTEKGLGITFRKIIPSGKKARISLAPTPLSKQILINIKPTTKIKQEAVLQKLEQPSGIVSGIADVGTIQRFKPIITTRLGIGIIASQIRRQAVIPVSARISIPTSRFVNKQISLIKPVTKPVSEVTQVPVSKIAQAQVAIQKVSLKPLTITKQLQETGFLPRLVPLTPKVPGPTPPIIPFFIPISAGVERKITSLKGKRAKERFKPSVGAIESAFFGKLGREISGIKARPVPFKLKPVIKRFQEFTGGFRLPKGLR